MFVFVCEWKESGVAMAYVCFALCKKIMPVLRAAQHYTDARTRIRSGLPHTSGKWQPTCIRTRTHDLTVNMERAFI